MKHSNCSRKTEKISRSTAIKATSLRSHGLIGPSVLTLLTLIVSFLSVFNYKAEAKPGKDFDFSDVWKDTSHSTSFTYNNNDKFGFDDDDNDRMDLIVQIIVGVVVFAMVAIFAFILCLCCPICILAKMRSRRRGVVYRSATTANGTTVTTQQNRAGTTITIGTPRAQTTPLQASAVAVPTSNPTMIAISNNLQQQNKPYPVQQSVTVVPVMPVMHQNQTPYPYAPQAQGYSQQHQTPYPSHQMPQPEHKDQYSNSDQYNPQELPPPYPGLSREMDTNNLPYNPYFSDAPPASAPSKY